MFGNLCQYCNQKLGQYETVQINMKRGTLAHLGDCLFDFVRVEMAGAVFVYRLRDKLALSKET